MNYVNRIKKFESSPLFKNYYQRFVSFLKLSGHYFKSKELEVVLGLSSREIRELAKYARRNGILITSSSKGYSYAKSHKQAEETLQGLKRRMEGLKVTIDAIEKSDHYKKLAKRI